MFNKVLITNRGAIAVRILRTLKRLQIPSLLIYSEADAHTLPVRLADEAVLIGAARASESYLNGPRIIEVALEHGCDALHPGYGFLSENAEFAQACENAGIAFIGPTATQMQQFGLKHQARALAEAARLPLLPGSELLNSLAEAQNAAQTMGYPVMLKSTAGGGGIGMQRCYNAEELQAAFAPVQQLAQKNFADGGVFVEKYIAAARHIEVQIFGDGRGQVRAVGLRDCSLQRRHQKVIEECPAPALEAELAEAMQQAAADLAASVQYRNAGTVEFLFDAEARQFYFLEVNTRLQVEHGVTEEVYGVDLVEWMLRCAASDHSWLETPLRAQGVALQCRLYAENPAQQFRPSPGLLTQVQWPAFETTRVRVDSWVESGTEVTAWYDPMLAKLIVHANDRDSALHSLQQALETTQLYGIESNRDYLLSLLQRDDFRNARHHTRSLEQQHWQPPRVEIIEAGTQDMIQQVEGRLGYWAVGIPPSGAMDALSAAIANQLLDNPPNASVLEMTVRGPRLKFWQHTRIAIAGADMQAQLNGTPIHVCQSYCVQAGDVLQFAEVQGGGQRSYLAVAGGFDCAEYLGNQSTFTLGRFGGHGGRCLQTGDFLGLPPCPADFVPQQREPLDLQARLKLRVMLGPHAAPEFFTESDIETFLASRWEVHYHSSRTGIRLLGPKPEWARTDGGEAGLHPSNIHDNAYAIGAIDFTGDMPIILGPDGPSLGGFVCPFTVIEADLWKLGQLSAGDPLQFSLVDWAEARRLKIQPSESEQVTSAATAILHQQAASAATPALCYRQQGDANILVEYGPLELDLTLRFRIHALMLHLQAQQCTEVIDITPGIRSLQLHFDAQRWSQQQALEFLLQAEQQLGDIDNMQVESRIVHLPLSWDDPSTQLAIQKYESVRPNAPWCPSNIEFIRRINGLDRIEEVKQILFEASWLVLGLGDVYLGAPVATPLDPRHRLVTTKYNPARTWTPENAVGIGGAYLCVYGMEGPGGYQFVGRTVQMWNRYHDSDNFEPDKPWLLRFFDQIRFYPVSEQDLIKQRDGFLQGEYPIRIESSQLSLAAYRAFLRDNASEISASKQRQQEAFEAERQRWIDSGQAHYEAPSHEIEASDDEAIPEGAIVIQAPMSGSVWSLLKAEGDPIELGENLLILEAMKTEIPVPSPVAGQLIKLLCRAGSAVRSGQNLAYILADTGAS